jgi:hypothetical protein
MLFRNPPRPVAVRAVLLGGGALVILAVIVCIGASAYYNVGMAGEIPAGRVSWMRPASRILTVGLLVLVTGLLSGAALDDAGASGEG